VNGDIIAITHKYTTKSAPMKYTVKIKWIDEIDSTNSAIQRRQEDFDNLSVLSARMQTAGRGQRGNRWETAPGENLTFSLLLLPGKDGVAPVKAARQFIISILSTLAVRDTLSAYGIEASVKWPNDIYVGDKKICGMLIENSLSGAEVASSIIGIGLNVNQTVFNPALVNPASMASVTGKRYDTEEVLESFAKFFAQRLEEASTSEGRASLRKEYVADMYRKDKPYQYTDCIDGEEFTGTIRGIDKNGRLLVEKPAAGLISYSFKEISYII